MVLTHILLTLHYEGSSLVRHIWNVFAVFGLSDTINEGCLEDMF